MSEWASAGRIAGKGLGAVVDVVAGVHDAIAERAESALPPGISHVAGIHRAHVASVYRGVAVAHRQIPAALASLAPDEAAVSESKVGRVALPVINGLWGDHLAAADEPLAIRMSIPREAPPVTPHLVFFVHGLCEDERAWEFETGSFGSWLERDLGVSALPVRYNSGRRISDNGSDLSDLIHEVVRSWPVPVESVALVGHSMGGLVCRSAAHQAGDWQPLLSHVISLGTPHLGSPVEKAVHIGDWTLRKIPQTRALGDFLTYRSVGIKDLRFGAVVPADWLGHDPDEFLRDRCTEVPPVEHVTYCWVAATIADDPEGVAARVIGDGLVRPASASGRGIPFDLGMAVGGVGHLALLHHEGVYEQLVAWLGD